MRRPFKILSWLLIAGFGAAFLGFVALAAAWLYIAPGLPSATALKDVRLQVPMRVYTRDGRLMQEYGVKRRIPLDYEDIPPLMIEAFIAAEDDRYFEHPGVDYQGLLRAVAELILTGEKSQGGSTITMQVARNYFLSRKKTYLRKLREIFLALKIDQKLSKEEVLSLYLNKIFLGQRSFGVGAAARVYFGTDVWHLNLAQIAMIAGLPRAPSLDNPVYSPENARARRGYVLGRMLANGFINRTAYERAMAQPIVGSYHGEKIEVSAPYVAEMVRDEMVDRYGEGVYTDGYVVTTTLDSRLQPLAKQALRDNLESYSRRHGYRGPVAHVDMSLDAGPEQWAKLLDGHPVYGDLHPALITAVGERDAAAFVPDVGVVGLDWRGLSWARPYRSVNSVGPRPDKAGDVVAAGDIVYLDKVGDDWQLSQVPEVGGALVSVDPVDGAIVALAGGFDFNLSKFNRATQAERQPGSAFKPFIYTAALAHGLTPATTINDAPVVVANHTLDSVWRPENYEHRFRGPTRLRVALVHSLNLVSVRVLRRIGIDYTTQFLSRFGFNPKKLPHYLSLALGSASVTPLQMARGYAVIANGGFLVQPYFIQRIVDSTGGRTLYVANPPVACDACGVQEATAPKAAPAPVVRTAGVNLAHVPQATSQALPAGTQLITRDIPSVNIAQRTLTPQDDYLITSMMRDVIDHGTGHTAKRIGRHDLAGKTGTTNDWNNAWFGGFNGNLVTIAYTGFDQVKTLGRPETGARAALPGWIDFMGPALADTPALPFIQPEGMVTVRIDSKTGLRTGPGDPNAMFETFRVDRVPPAAPSTRFSQARISSSGDVGALNH
ncbi:MAG TPA: penicillin-binding protein 1A [Gammaproteobacteria bacterium]|nr:penicillin-binding protein 1A [Gammaproteobacteria bacterium]